MLLSIAIIVAQTVVLHKLFLDHCRRMPPRVRADVSHLSPEQRRRYAVTTNVLGTILYMSLWPVIASRGSPPSRSWPSSPATTSMASFTCTTPYSRPASDRDGRRFVLCAPAALVLNSSDLLADLPRADGLRRCPLRGRCPQADGTSTSCGCADVFRVDVSLGAGVYGVHRRRIVERRWWSFAEDGHPYTAVPAHRRVKPYERRPTQLPPGAGVPDRIRRRLALVQCR